jgi:hypothetical protein
VRRPGFNVESEVGFIFEVDEIELASFSGTAVFWLGLVIVPLDCFVVWAGEDEPERVVSFSSALSATVYNAGS